MESLSIASVPVLTGIVYIALWLYKYAVYGKERFIRLIPVIAALLGAVLGVVGFYAADGLIPADNVLTALLIGAVAGLAATGTHQIFKQFNQPVYGEQESDKDLDSENKADESKPDDKSR